MVASYNTDVAIAALSLSRAWGGLEMNILNHLRWMTARGRQMILYAHPEGRLYAEAQSLGIPVRAVDSTFRYGDVVNAYRLARLIKTDNVRAMSVHLGQDVLLAVLAHIFAGKSFKLIFSQHMHVGNKKDFFHAWEYRHFSAWVTPLDLLAERAAKNTVVPRNKIYVVPQGIELNRFTENLPDKIAARKALNLPDSGVILGIVGRLDPQKGQDTAIQAVSALHRAGRPVHLVILGEHTAGEHENYVEHLKALIAENNLGQYVHFRPFRKDIETVYAALDIFVMASHSETYGMVTIEAMVSGVPVIATRAGGTVEIVEDGVTGLLFPPREAGPLAEAVKRYLDNPQFAVDIAHRARESAVKRYSHIAQCEGWERVLGEVLN